MNAQELEQLIVRASQAYYEGHPIMSDARFDQYVVYLRSINPHSEVLNRTGWGYEPESGNKVPHKHGGMGSIKDKPRTMQEIPDRLLQDVRISAKLDGLSGVVHFENGEFIRCLTRGNGVIGIDKTDKFNALLEKYQGCNVPKEFTGEIRGEFLISHANWDKMVEAGTVKKNPRNAASGIINANDIPEDIQYLDFIPYKVIWDPNSIFGDKVLDEMGECSFCKWFPNFPGLPKAYKESYTENDLIDMYNGWNAIWPCDGVVITSNTRERTSDDTFIYDEVAYKFDSLKAETTVESIEWQLSRQSLLIPVANLKPVEIGGSTISRATLHNAGNVVRSGIAPGSVVEILKSGDVIPYINEVISNPEHELNSEIIKECPYCHEPTSWSGVHIMCKNSECGNKDFSDLMMWVKSLSHVDGIADILLIKYLDRFHIQSVEDLYHIDGREFEMLKDEGVQSNKFLDVLTDCRNAPHSLDEFLIGLNIPRLGEVTAKKLATDSKFQDLMRKLAAEETISDIEPWYAVIREVVGEATAKTVTDYWMKLCRVRHIAPQLEYPEPEANVEYKFVCITGKLQKYSRKELEGLLLKHGYKAKEEVSKKVSYLITNTPDSSTSKNKRATELGIPKVTEEEFLKLIGITNE